VLVFEAGASSGTSYLKVASTSNPTEAKPGLAAGTNAAAAGALAAIVALEASALMASSFLPSVLASPTNGLMGLPRGTAAGPGDWAVRGIRNPGMEPSQAAAKNKVKNRTPRFMETSARMKKL
jgi:hypothetical protein